VPPIGDGDVMSSGDPDGRLAHGHRSVGQDDRKVQDESGCHDGGGGQPAIDRDERQKARVRRNHDTSGEPLDCRHRDGLHRKAQERHAPPVEPNLLEPPEASTEQETDTDRNEKDQQDEGHGDVRWILSRSRDGVQGGSDGCSLPLEAMTRDLGYFGPESVSWQVHREVTVLFGGARAVLMQAAHPLVIAGARETGFYERDPWKRLQRTLILTYTMTFGSKAEAHAAADRINQVHARVKGTDPVTGKPYDGLDPELLLWVHACLVDSALLFEARTVGRLDREGREQFHQEQMLAAELVKIPRETIPPTVPALRAWMADRIDRGDLLVTDTARSVARLFVSPPPEAQWRAVLRGVARLAFGTLPPHIREMYGVSLGPIRRAEMSASFAATRMIRPFLPPKVRYIAPYQAWRRGDPGAPTGGTHDRLGARAGP
jgi:uncharacterized protein (DUF2236 family)